MLCGDATDGPTVSRLLDGATPFLMVTDPPYGVDYDPAWREEAAKKGLIGFPPSALGVVPNDGTVDWSAALKHFCGDVAYVWHAGLFAGEVGASLARLGFDLRAQIVWRKPSFAISRGHYNWQHEPCWYAVRHGRSADFIGSKSEPTVWEAARAVSNGHSAQKPLECMARPIRNHDAPEVYDPFVGSGTTLIAAEKLGRRCFALEIDPAYCDVVVERFENLTGEKATRA